ncbi:UNVERIFIED_CONTAM: hypothetical protein N8J90_05865 [Halobacillus marinus]|uniref:hypothetical protein n=1 Tax=Bacillaceae TaxID=186817 RepID=UPI0002A4DF82|nr:MULTISPECIES: hypothetical protein [Bacillaceae]ELK48070.1 hypothetical protein D479_04123 [Halobacillus sp. BAB-2008]QHT45625.1 hypothetical protein M662_03575 [Bacillus sp. SB49]
MKTFIKILKISGIVIGSIFALLVLIGMFMPGEIDVYGEGDSEKPDNLTVSMDTYITDEDYEPTEVAFLTHTIAALNEIDNQNWGALDAYFLYERVYETALRDVYMNKEVDPEHITDVHYTVRNKQFQSYLDEQPVSPLSTETDHGVEWATFQYDVWVTFSFELERVITDDEDRTYTDRFEVQGDYPPHWQSSMKETHWRLNSLMLRPLENE